MPEQKQTTSRLPRLGESYGESLDRTLVAKTPGTPNQPEQPSMLLENPRLRRAFGLAGAVMVLAGGAAMAEGAATARTVNGIIEQNANYWSVPKAPKPGEGTSVKIEDIISYKGADGKTYKRRVRTLSDIAQAANDIDPNLDVNTLDASLESENHGSAIVQPGQSFEVSKDLGIKDMGPSG